MEIVSRIRNILITPKTEWTVIDKENTPHVRIFTLYVLPLAMIPAVSAFVGYGLIGYPVMGHHIHSINWGTRQAINLFILSTGGLYIASFVINLLSGCFGARKNLDKAFSLAAYACTPIFIGSVFYMFSMFSWLTTLAGLYSLYLLYFGLQPLMKPSKDRAIIFFIVSLMSIIVVGFMLRFVLSIILRMGTAMLL